MSITADDSVENASSSAIVFGFLTSLGGVTERGKGRQDMLEDLRKIQD